MLGARRHGRLGSGRVVRFCLCAALVVACGGRSTTNLENGDGASARGGSLSTGGSGGTTKGTGGDDFDGGTGGLSSGVTGGSGGTKGSCYYAGTYYAYGDTYAAGDGCNYCTCTSTGSDCGSSPCGGVSTATGGTAGSSSDCVHDGVSHMVGDAWVEDDCTHCACTTSGVACSTEDCGSLASCSDILKQWNAAYNAAAKCTPGPGACNALVTNPQCRCQSYVSTSVELDPLLWSWDNQLCSQNFFSCPLCPPLGMYHYCDDSGQCVSSDAPEAGGAGGMGGSGGATGLAGMAGFSTGGLAGAGGVATGGLGGAGGAATGGLSGAAGVTTGGLGGADGAATGGLAGASGGLAGSLAAGAGGSAGATP